MPNTAKLIENFLSESKDNRKKEKQKANRPREIKRERNPENPDAVVLVRVHEVCRNCGNSTSHHNRHMMLRLSRSFKVPDKWIHQYEGLPREILERTEYIDACIECFEVSGFDYLIREGKKER